VAPAGGVEPPGPQRDSERNRRAGMCLLAESGGVLVDSCSRLGIREGPVLGKGFVRRIADAHRRWVIDSYTAVTGRGQPPRGSVRHPR